MGFKLWPPRFKRAAGRPRSRRIKGSEEGGKQKSQRQCKRCGGFGHMMKTCNETVYDSDTPPPAPPKPKRAKKKKSTATTTISTQQSQIEALTNSSAANTRSRKRALELGGEISSPIIEVQHQKKKKKKVVTTKATGEEMHAGEKEASNAGKRISKKKLILDL
ncbi:unnamed protein product [Miscanthus lutarioriparius]|uniref:CCHC-type domain-containing protein n=1 Tax=Miscanthus lutarioriparius TaxID=422564 RepID=A0A811NQU0_9POAL|nr:unnamed protein product [Miscanthus lutarioriparius]